LIFFPISILVERFDGKECLILLIRVLPNALDIRTIKVNGSLLSQFTNPSNLLIKLDKIPPVLFLLLKNTLEDFIETVGFVCACDFGQQPSIDVAVMVTFLGYKFDNGFA
jgi:hypothetical protein